ncbi:MAG: hypothetical protein SFX73_10065, partial [Kofleriaceae bacterium]|nr:hypothetical protein [Kofleriaceae bacterium]
MLIIDGGKLLTLSTNMNHMTFNRQKARCAKDFFVPKIPPAVHAAGTSPQAALVDRAARDLDSRIDGGRCQVFDIRRHSDINPC